MRVKRRIYSGSVLEQEVYTVPDGVRDPRKAEPSRPRFATEEERKAHRRKISERRFVRMVNHNCNPKWFYVTLTLDNAHEVHTFEEARRIRDWYFKRLRRINPGVKIIMVMGRGGTGRIHYHALIFGVTEEQLLDKWTFGRIVRCEHLWEHVKYDDGDHGQDYTSLAEYLFGHWTEEQGERSHRWKATRNVRPPEPEDAVEVKRHGGYSEERPPVLPKGYVQVGYESNGFGYQRFIYVIDPKTTKRPPGRPPKKSIPII